MKRYSMSVDLKNIAKMSTLPKAIYRYSTTPIKIPMALFIERKETIFKYLWTLQYFFNLKKGKKLWEKERTTGAWKDSC